MKKLNELVEDLNYELWNCDDTSCYMFIDATHIQYITYYSEGIEIPLYDSEEYNYESEKQMVKLLKDNLNKAICKLNIANKILIVN